MAGKQLSAGYSLQFIWLSLPPWEHRPTFPKFDCATPELVERSKLDVSIGCCGTGDATGLWSGRKSSGAMKEQPECVHINNIPQVGKVGIGTCS